ALHAGPAGRRLAIVGESRAGAPAEVSVRADEAVRISTGAAVPDGADAILPVEEADDDGATVTPSADVAPGQHVREPGDDLRGGEVVLRDGTVLGAAELGVAVAALAAGAGTEVIATTAVVDDEHATRAAIERALDGTDVLLLTGGVSVGPHDHVKPALAALGVEEVFWRVAMRPGKPLWFGRRGEQLVFGLPGNPVSAMVCFLLFA